MPAIPFEDRSAEFEQLRRNEKRDRAPSFQETEAAFMNIFGDWKTFIGKEEYSVRPLSSKDISWLGGAIARAVQKKENAAIEGVMASPSAEEQGEAARAATLETQTAVQGEVEFLNKLLVDCHSVLANQIIDEFISTLNPDYVN